MQLETLESLINQLYRMNLKKLISLSDLRGRESGLSLANVSEYNVRVKDDDRYLKIKVEIDLINAGGSDEQLHHILSKKLDELSEDSIERIRLSGAGKKAKPPFSWDEFKRIDNDREFLKSCSIKGDTSWIK